MGGCFLSVGLLISSLTKNQIVAGFLTFAMFLMLWIINWFGESVGPDRPRHRELPVDHRALRRLRQGHHRHETRRLLPEFHHVRTVPDGQVGRQRTLARVASVMLKRVLGLLGWLGVALVFAAVAIRFCSPSGSSGTTAWRSPASSCTLLYILSQWREIARSFSGRQARFGSLAAASVARRARHPRRDQLPGTRHNKRWDLTAAQAVLAVGSDEEGPAGPEEAGARPRVRADRRLRAVPRTPRRVPVRSRSSCTVEYIDPEKRPALANQYQGARSSARSCSSTTAATERVTSDGEQELTNGLIKVMQGKQNKVYFVQGHGERSHRRFGPERLQHDRARRSRPTTSRPTRSCSRSRAGAGRRSRR